MEVSIAVFTALLLLGWGAPFPVAADPALDKFALLDFIRYLPHGRLLNWNPFIPSAATGSASLAAPTAPAYRPIPPNTISRLSALQTLSLRSNSLTGPLPADFILLTSLTDLHLQQNGFSGLLPSDFSVWPNLTVLDLSFNAFNGSIPSSISNLTQLTALNLSNNSLSGSIPDLQLPNLKLLNLSYNRLVGTIPGSLRLFPISSFSGNNLSPTNFTRPSPSPSPSPSPLPSPTTSPVSSSPGRKLSESVILGIIVGGCVLGFAIFAAVLLVVWSRKKQQVLVSGKLVKRERSTGKEPAGNQGEVNPLVFFEGCTFAFDLEDLLRASAEVLGKGTFGTAYKALLEDSTAVVVKRLKDVGVGKREFEQQMATIGRLKHENIVELRAYYYSKDEKLMVYDYFSPGSVSSMLHGRQGEERTPLGWETRLRIALGAARGIAHLHSDSGGNLVHGNIRSSNIFLNQRLYGCLSDVGLALLAGAGGRRPVGYRAPELVDGRRPTQSSDIYSFGVFLLELLTGKTPVRVAGGAAGEVVHLVRWVQSVVREEWTAEVFDVELMRCPEVEEGLVEMLRVAMVCVAAAPEQRPAIADVVRMIADVGRSENDAADRSSSGGAVTPAGNRFSSPAAEGPPVI
ncbi:unnamed protein product [Spirodela intermedia]|uniref:Protein kinase domain-containing protein n=1 Tax=Spirodela intermedia TaxID=51605 RepID=A0A7I8ITA6_SPIIN|nr:unnamed protein product [Spirodela intermedia]CAA6661036.1 unnamed protein product [Spirodela intermedia]